MTQREFETRVEVKVSSKEFENINEMYMNSDVDKDEFCTLWVKMNFRRVQQWKKANGEANKAREEKEKALDIYCRMVTMSKWSENAMTTLKRKEIIFLESIGIEMYDKYGYRSMSAVAYDIMHKYGMVA